MTQALWMILLKLGVPDRTVKLVRSFHKGMTARVRIEGSLSDKIEVNNGLRQSCYMSPVLFNLFSCVVLERWMQKLEGVGVQLYYKYD